MHSNRLNRQQIEQLSLLKNKEKKRVLFVCLGNICRSPAANGIMQQIIDADNATDCWEVDSCGIGQWHVGDLPDRRMRVHAQRRGLVLDHVCRQIKASDFDRFDVIFAMDNANVDDLRELAPSLEAQRKIIPMALFVDSSFHCDHIPDPYYSGAEGFEHVLDLLDNACSNFYNAVK